MKKIQNIIGWEKNFLFSDKNFFWVGGIFLEERKVFAVWKPQENQELEGLESEKIVKKNRISEKEIDELWNTIEKNTKQTDLTNKKLFNDFENRVFKNNSFESNILIPELRVRSFEWDVWYITVWDKWDKFKNNISKKLKQHTEGINNEYNKVCEREFYYASLKENLEKEISRLENWINRSQEVLNNLWWIKSSLLTIYEKWVVWLAWDKIKEKFHSREAKKQIEKMKDTLKKVEEKELENDNRKTELEDFIWTKTEKLDGIMNTFDDIFNDYAFEKEEIENFKEFLNKNNWISTKTELTNFFKKNTWFYDKLKNMNWNDRMVFDKLLKSYRTWVSKEVKEFNSIKNKYENYEEDKDFYKQEKEKLDKNTLFDKEFNEKDFRWMKLKSEKFLLKDWKEKEFHWNYEWKKIWDKFLFIEKWKDWENLDWDESSVLVFDKEKWFVEVDDEFLKKLEDKKLKNNIEKKISNLSYEYENSMSELKENLENKDKIFKILESYKKLWKKFKNISEKSSEQEKHFKKYFKVLEKKADHKIENRAKIDAKKNKSVNNTDYKWENNVA